MDTKHTPGPWTVDGDQPWAHHPRVYGADGSLVCDVGNAVNEDGEIWEANARLIAAALDMLAALQALVAEEEEKQRRGWVSHPQFDAAHAAIVKATGVPRP